MKNKNLAVIGIGFLAIGAIAFFASKSLFSEQLSNITPTPTASPTSESTPTPTPTSELITYNGTTPSGYTNFIEVNPKVNGQQGYVAFPKVIQKDDPPAIVIYYHGSGQTITTAFTDQVMLNMRAYGAYFTSRNMAFLASNQHGDNWGSSTAVEDSRALIAFVRNTYATSPTVYVLGFSMGGMPAIRHVILYHTEVTKIALLAPAQEVESYTPTQFGYFKTVLLKIWHGTSDVNVPYSATQELISYFKKYNVPVVVATLKGKTHWDVDTEYMSDIYAWFTSKN